MRVYDSLRVHRASEVTCTFTILRNTNAPTWDVADFGETIRDTHPVLGDVTRVTASDVDPYVSDPIISVFMGRILKKKFHLKLVL